MQVFLTRLFDLLCVVFKVQLLTESFLLHQSAEPQTFRFLTLITGETSYPISVSPLFQVPGFPPAVLSHADSGHRLFAGSLSACFQSGSHLLSHAVSSIVPSAAWVLTIVFGMGTGVSPRRIATRNFVMLAVSAQSNQDGFGKLASSKTDGLGCISGGCRDRRASP